MDCPACDSILEPRKYHRLTLNVCTTCQGIWFDPGEVMEFIEDVLIDRDDIPDAPIEINKRTINLYTLKEQQRKCPRCRKPMDKVNYGADSNVVIDRCSACGGVWVDRGEIELMASHVKGNPKLWAMGNAIIESRKEMEDEMRKVESNLVNILLFLWSLL